MRSRKKSIAKVLRILMRAFNNDNEKRARAIFFEIIKYSWVCFHNFPTHNELLIWIESSRGWERVKSWEGEWSELTQIGWWIFLCCTETAEEGRIFGNFFTTTQWRWVRERVRAVIGFIWTRESHYGRWTLVNRPIFPSPHPMIDENENRRSKINAKL